MIEVLEQEVGNITRMIWQSMLHLEVENMPEITRSCSRTEIGVIYIQGAWNGVVVLQAPFELAETAASRIFSIGREELTADLLQDAWSEVTNMIGGNIKSLLPEPCTLSMPTTVVGENFEVRIPGSRLRYRQFFRCEGLPFVVNVFQQDSVDPGARSWVGPGLN